MIPMSKKEKTCLQVCQAEGSHLGGLQRPSQYQSSVTASKPSSVSCRGGVRSNGLGKVASSFGQTIPVSCRQLISSQQSL